MVRLELTRPKAHRAGLDSRDENSRDVLLAPFETPARQRRLLWALVGHAVSFWTWRSLCVDHGLPNASAAQAMAALVLAHAGAKR